MSVLSYSVAGCIYLSVFGGFQFFHGDVSAKPFRPVASSGLLPQDDTTIYTIRFYPSSLSVHGLESTHDQDPRVGTAGDTLASLPLLQS